MAGAGQPLVWGGRATSPSAIAVGVRSSVGRQNGAETLSFWARPCAGVPVLGFGGVTVMYMQVPKCNSVLVSFRL